MSRYGDYYPKSGPRLAATGGTASKSRSGDIGETWWSRRFVTALEGFTASSRLTRGRSYARSGQVIGLAVAPGAVTAKVQGSRSRPYDVHIGVTPLTAPQWAQVETALAERALFAAALLAGEMPKEIEEVFTAVGHPLFPSSGRHVTTRCSCPDSANPCKHVAAAYYILAERFDEAPFLMLAWRGRTQEELVARLRALRATEEVVSTPDVVTAPPLASRVADFWAAGPEALAARFQPDPAALPDALARRLGPIPDDRGALATALAPAWPRIASGALRRALSD